MSDGTETLAWFREHVLAFEVGTLEHEDAVRFRALLEQPEYRLVYDAMVGTELDGESPGHIPVRYVVGWPDSIAALSESEQQLLRAHYARCDTCRAEARLGTANDTRAAGHPARPDRSRDSRFRWVLGAWAGAATALAATLLIVPLLRPTPKLIPHVDLTGTRGTAPRVEIEPSARQLELTVRPTIPPLVADAPMCIALSSPDGATIAVLRRSSTRSVDVTFSSDSTFIPGPYTVLLWNGDPLDAPSNPVRHLFEVVVPR